MIAYELRNPEKTNIFDFGDSNSLYSKFVDSFKFGRKTVEDCSWNIGFMPDPENSCGQDTGSTAGLKQIFVENIFAERSDAWALTAAIMGAHTLGSAH